MKRALLESLLFTSAKPLTYKEISKILAVPYAEIVTAVKELAALYNQAGRGVHLVESGEEVQFLTAPECRAFVEDYLKEEITGELTRPQLETLTIIAYRGPISKAAIEQIRGSNCSIILRNLLWRGLIQEAGGTTVALPVYEVTMEFVRYLGVTKINQLPEYDHLHVCELSSPLSPLPPSSAS